MKKMLSFFFLALLISQSAFSADVTWSSPPVTLSSSTSDNSTNPKVALDSNGNATAVWVENGIVQGAYLSFGGNWGAPTALSNLTFTSSNPSVVVDSNGNATALWLDQKGVVNSSTLPFGGSWGASVTVSAPGASIPQLAVDPSGNLVAVWVRNSVIESSTKLVAGIWDGPVIISSSFGSSPQVAISANGQVVAVWHSLVSSIYTVFAATKTINAAAWNTPAGISDSSVNSLLPLIALDPNGNAVAVWFTYTITQSSTIYDNVSLASASLTSAGVWDSSPEIVTTDSSVVGRYNPFLTSASLAIDPAGNAFLAWTESKDGSTFNLNTMIKAFGDGWTARAAMDLQDPFCYSTNVAATASGLGFLNFMVFDGTNINIQNAVTSLANPRTTGFFIGPDTLSTGTINGFPSMAAVSNGNNLYSVAVWENYNGTNSIIQSSSGQGIIDLPASNVLATQSSTNYGIFTEYKNTVTWDASPDPRIAAYNIYRNGLLIGQVASPTLTWVDINRMPGEIVTYGVESEMTDGSRSATATFVFKAS